MFTVCPKCTLTLVVTTVDLRAGQGYVRCGRCANVFNALIALREGDPSAGPPSESARRRVLETPPQQPLEPAMGAGVALEDEPEAEPPPAPEPSPGPTHEATPQADVESIEEDIAAQIEASAARGIDIDFDALLGGTAQEEPAEEPLAEEAVPEEAVEEPVFEEPELEEPLPEEYVAESVLAPDSEDAALEFDDTSTDVSEIFVAPEAERGTGSGSYEAVVLAVEPPPEALQPIEPEPPIEAASEAVDDESHRDTIAADDWSLLDDDEPPAEEAPAAAEPLADDESVIEESPLAGQADEETADEVPAEDPPWVEEMFAEAEAKAVRERTGERRALDTPAGNEEEAEPAATGTGDAPLDPLLAPGKPARPQWQYIAGVAVLSIALVLQVIHHYRQRLVLNPTVGSWVSTVYGWFGATVTPLWDIKAYTVKQLGAEAEGGEGARLRVRLSLQNDSDRVQPLPLLRLTLLDRFNSAVATRDLEPREYLPPRATDLRLLEPNQRIDAELHVIDPGKAAVGFEIDACLRSETGAIGCANDARRRTPG